MQPYPSEVEQCMQRYYQSLSEKDRRRHAAIEALKLGWGGKSYISRLFNCDDESMQLGLSELDNPDALNQTRIRRPGGGRKSALASIEGIDAAFLKIIAESTAGSPMDAKVKWTHLEPIRITEYTGGMKQETQTNPKTQRTRNRTPNNPTTTQYRISDQLWELLEPLLPKRVNTHRFGGGRPRVPDRQCADAIFFVLRTGCQWEALNQTNLCAKSTAHDRFQEWVEADVFLKLWQEGVQRFDELGGIDWAWLSMDGAMTKAPLGGEKDRRQSN